MIKISEELKNAAKSAAKELDSTDRISIEITGDIGFYVSKDKNVEGLTVLDRLESEGKEFFIAIKAA